ncbi:MAG TPA: hypothetical protein VGJ74_17165 [Burkholderiales bacterium]|jgi:hypothetical protein
MKKAMVVLWSSFLAAGVAEVLFFTVIDPGELFFLGRQVELGPLATYSVGFLLFWLLTAASSALTCFLLRASEPSAAV